MTSSRERVEQLGAATEHFRLAIEAAPTGMLVMNRAGEIVLVNSHIERLFGYTAEQLHGRLLETLVPERFREGHAQFRASFFKAPKVRPSAGRELYGLRADGTEVPIEIGLNPLAIPEGDFVLSSVVDVTERKLSRLERDQLLEQLRALDEELEARVSNRTAELSAALEERGVLLREIHHRVKNNLQVISSLINMEVRQLPGGSSRDALVECQTRVQAIALLHEMLYESKDYCRVPFSEYSKNLARQVFRVAGRSLDDIALELAVEDISLTVDRASPCGLILNELISNSLRHAFPGDRRGSIRVELRRVPPSFLELAVADDGVGVPEDFEPRAANSRGMDLVATLVDQLEGSLEVSREGGTRFSVRFAQASA